MDFCYPHDSSFFELGYWWTSQPNSAIYGFRRELLRRMLLEGPSFLSNKLKYCTMTNTEMVADDRNSGAVPSPDTLFSSYNDRVLYLREAR